MRRRSGLSGIARVGARLRRQPALRAPLAVERLALGRERRFVERRRRLPHDPMSPTVGPAPKTSASTAHGRQLAPAARPHGIASHESHSPPCALRTGYAGVATSRVPAP